MDVEEERWGVRGREKNFPSLAGESDLRNRSFPLALSLSIVRKNVFLHILELDR